MYSAPHPTNSHTALNFKPSTHIFTHPVNHGARRSSLEMMSEFILNFHFV